MFRLFSMLPVVIETLAELSREGDASHTQWASSLLRSLSGDQGFVKIVSAAVTADAMVHAWRFIRLCDTAADDSALGGLQASRLLYELKLLLHDGGLFAPSAAGTLTHSALLAIQDKVVFTGDHEPLAIRWPSLTSDARKEPVLQARQSEAQTHIKNKCPQLILSLKLIIQGSTKRSRPSSRATSLPSRLPAKQTNLDCLVAVHQRARTRTLWLCSTSPTTWTAGSERNMQLIWRSVLG